MLLLPESCIRLRNASRKELLDTKWSVLLPGVCQHTGCSHRLVADRLLLQVLACCLCTHWNAVGKSCAGSKCFPRYWCTHTCTCDCRCIPSCAALSQLWLECSTLPYALCVGEMLNCASPSYLCCPLATRSCRHKDYPYVQLSLVNLNISSP